MENFDTAQRVKAKREGTMGNVPEAGPVQAQPRQMSRPAPQAPNRLAQKVQEAKAKQDSIVEPQATEDKPKALFVKGLQVGITEDGFIKLIPFGDTNYIDIVSLIEYARVKKDDILAELAASKSHQVTKEVTEVSKNIKHLLTSIGE